MHVRLQAVLNQLDESIRLWISSGIAQCGAAAMVRERLHLEPNAIRLLRAVEPDFYKTTAQTFTLACPQGGQAKFPAVYAQAAGTMPGA